MNYDLSRFLLFFAWDVVYLVQMKVLLTTKKR